MTIKRRSRGERNKEEKKCTQFYSNSTFKKIIHRMNVIMAKRFLAAVINMLAYGGYVELPFLKHKSL